MVLFYLLIRLISCLVIALACSVDSKNQGDKEAVANVRINLHAGRISTQYVCTIIKILTTFMSISKYIAIVKI